MFKAQILRRSFSLFNRVPTSQIVRSAIRDGHETINIQRVRFRKPFFSRSRLLGTAIIAAGTYGFLQWALEEVEDEDEERQHAPRTRQRDPQEKSAMEREGDEDYDEDEDEDQEDDDDDDDDAILFLPTGLSRPKPKTFYRGSDPEWQEFVRIAPDRQRMDRIRAELVGMIRDLALRNPQYVMRLGKINPSAGNAWIEYKFPDGPPIEYERPGIEITEDLEIRWTTRPVHELHHHRLNNILFPIAAANSLYADTKRKAGRTWQEFRIYMGWEDKSQSRQFPKIIAQVPHPPPNARTTSSTTPTSAHGSPLAPSAPNDTQQQSSATSTSQKEPASPPFNPAYERFGVALPKPAVLTLDLSYFRQVFRREFKPYKIQPPRGTFIVTGLVEIIGERARMTLDVAAAYDPKIGQYVMLKAQLRSITDFRQVPKGGP